ncbi:MAG: hypothetical protein ACK4S4_00940 [Pyrinomonadaceae bacterium]
MNRFRSFFAVFTAAMMFASLAGAASAQTTRSERQVRDLVRSINSQLDDFQYKLDYQLESSSADRRVADDARMSIGNLQDKMSAFQENFDRRRENRSDVNDIVAAAKDVDAFLRGNPQNASITGSWTRIKDLISQLAGGYGVTPDWGVRVSNAMASVPGRGGLTGTYRLDPSRSESTDQILSESGVTAGQRQDLEQKLAAPEQIAIDIRGDQVTLASSIAQPVTFIADGRQKTEQANGRTILLRATLRGSELSVSSLGGETDYTVTFVSQDGGQTLKVTRRITTDYLRQTIFAESVYTKTDGVARLGINAGGSTTADTSGGWSSSDQNDRGRYGDPPTVTSGRTGEFIVPNGTVLTGMLESTIDTKASQNNDRFKLTVQTPIDFRGAVIEGYITGVGRSGRVSGRSNVTFNFESITLRDGQRYDFAGFLQAVKDQNGKDVKVDTEGTAKSGSQTKETAKRGGIGAGLGAVIGAIAGGGTGAVVGAVIGGSVGAGSVIVQGRDDLQLLKGSVFTIQASSPIRNDAPNR